MTEEPGVGPAAEPRPAPAAQPYVQLQSLVRQFPGVRALDGASLELGAGEVVGLLGKNGAGKSSLIKILAGLDRPDGGEVLVGGRPVPTTYDPRTAHRLGLAFVHQELATVPGLTVAENVALGGRYPRRAGVLVDRATMRRQVRELLERLDIRVGVGQLVGDLSSTQQRLVMIARALHHDARVLVLDEPTTSFTHVEVEHLHRLVRELRAEGHGILYVSHRLAEVKQLTDRVVVMKDGAVVAEHRTADVTEPDMVAAITGRSAAQVRSERPRTSAAREGGQPLLRVQGLVTDAVHDVSFDVHGGEVLGLAGLVGSGRSEIVRAVFGADPRSGGTVEVEGRLVPVTSPVDAVRAGIGLLPEDRRHQGLVRDFSVQANTTLASLRRHVRPVTRTTRRSSERAAARAAIDQLSIAASSPDVTVGELSGGNQQKVVVAKWVEAGSRVLVFDEPTQGVDVGAREEIFRVIEEVAAAGKAVVVISSDFTELVRACTRVLGVREGRLSGELRAEQITEEALIKLAYASAH